LYSSPIFSMIKVEEEEKEGEWWRGRK